MSEDLGMIAARISELRDIYGFTACQVAEQLGIPVQVYEGYEKDGNDIPISALYRLAKIYGVELTEILVGSTPRINTFTVVPAGHGIKIDRYSEYHIQSLAQQFRDKIMEPMLVTLDYETKAPALVTHGGQEFNYILSGSIYFLFEDKRLLLNEGDCVYFDPTHPHGQMASSESGATFLTVITDSAT